MGLLSGNSCSIITILPLGGVCNVINTSTPQTTDGLISLVVTGGSAPYDVRWDNGQIGTTLTNLTTGTYAATIIDYYGDYTATTFCTVGNTSFYLEEFQNCSNNASYVYYVSDLTNPQFATNSVYMLTTQIGCWTRMGSVLYTGQTYNSNYAQKQLNIGGPYVNCSSCLPAVPATPVYPEKLCLQSTLNSVTTQIDFSSGSTINGTPSWSSVTPNYIIYYNNTSGRWLLSGITLSGGGIVYKQNPSIPPTGVWTVTGPNASTLSINVNSGICGSIPLSFLSLSTNNPQNNTILGSVTMIGNGGLQPYSYSINGNNYQQGGTFSSLGSGTYTAYVKDSNNTIFTQSFSLVVPPTITYTLNITPTNNQMVTNGTTSKSSNQTFTFSVNPPLPVGKSITFKLQTVITTTGFTAGSFTPTFITNQTTNITSTLTPTSMTQITVPRPACSATPGVANLSGVTYTYNTVTIVGGGTLPTGTLNLTVNTPTVISTSAQACATYGKLICSVKVLNIAITPSTNNIMSSTALTPVIFPIENTGTISP